MDMPRPRGLAKTGGRKKGTPNKFSYRLPWLARELARAGLPPAAIDHRASPLDCLLEIMRNPSAATAQRLAAATAAAPFFHRRMKPAEMPPEEHGSDIERVVISWTKS